jgi:hypothetical protein
MRSATREGHTPFPIREHFPHQHLFGTGRTAPTLEASTDGILTPHRWDTRYALDSDAALL